MEAIFATICSTEDDDCATLPAWDSILTLSCLIVRTICSIVAAVSVTLAAWVNACCFTPSILALISWTELAVSVILFASSFPISSIATVLAPTDRIDSPIFAMVSLKYVAISVISSFPNNGKRTVKSPSPCAIFCNTETAVWMGLTMVRASKYTTINAETRMTTPTIIIVSCNVLIASKNSLTGARIITNQSTDSICAKEAI